MLTNKDANNFLRIVFIRIKVHPAKFREMIRMVSYSPWNLFLSLLYRWSPFPGARRALLNIVDLLGCLLTKKINIRFKEKIICWPSRHRPHPISIFFSVIYLIFSHRQDSFYLSLSFIRSHTKKLIITGPQYCFTRTRISMSLFLLNLRLV